MTRLSFFPLLLTGLVAAGCSDSGGSAAPSGQTLYEQRHADGNTFACATCHALEEPAADAGLVRGHDHPPSGTVEPRDGIQATFDRAPFAR